MKSNGCKSRPVKASEQAGSESCHSPGDWWVRSVDNKEAGREDQPRNRSSLRGRRLQSSGRQYPAATAIARSGRLAGVPSPGHAPQGWPRNRRELPISSHTRRTASGNGSGGTCNQGSTGGSADGSGAVLQPHSTDEGGEPQGSRKGRPRDPLEGRGKQAYESVERRHHETQNSEPYVHRHQQNS